MPEVTEESFRRALDVISERQKAYQIAFLGKGVASMVEDLRKFCRADETCFHPDPRVHAVLEGRREVWIRIQEHLTVDPTALVEKYNSGSVRVIRVETEDEDGPIFSDDPSVT